MEKSFELIVLLFAALATGRLIVNWIGLGRAMPWLSVLTGHSAGKFPLGESSREVRG
jgi:hypothetical protein